MHTLNLGVPLLPALQASDPQSKLESFHWRRGDKRSKTRVRKHNTVENEAEEMVTITSKNLAPPIVSDRTGLSYLRPSCCSYWSLSNNSMTIFNQPPSSATRSGPPDDDMWYVAGFLASESHTRAPPLDGASGGTVGSALRSWRRAARKISWSSFRNGPGAAEIPSLAPP